MLPISLHACVLLRVGLKATSQGRVELLSHSFPPKAEVEGVPFPPNAGAQLKPSATFLSERATERGGVHPAQVFRRRLPWEFLVTGLENRIACSDGTGEKATPLFARMNVPWRLPSDPGRALRGSLGEVFNSVLQMSACLGILLNLKKIVPCST